jgi:DNA-binding MarR family transcriptional regulator
MATPKALPNRPPDSDYPAVLSARVGFLLAQAHLIAREEADRALAEFGLSAKEFGALATVVTDAPISQQRLSRRLRVDPATMVDVIDELDGAGHIARRRNPEDRREYALEATTKGRALFSRAQKAVMQAERHTFRGLRADELSILTRLLERLAARGDH